MTDYTKLPKIMVAPNGARRGKADHPALPITIAEVVETAKACEQACADGIHAHVRDSEGKHCLDAGQYRELIAELEHVVPNMFIQITTEAVGIYSPEQQRAVVRESQPKAVSISIREMLSEGENDDVTRFYHEQAEAQTAIQHILYSTEDVELLKSLMDKGTILTSNSQLLFVLGRYTKGQISSPADLAPFVQSLSLFEEKLDWGCCAFGQLETRCLLEAFKQGGKARIGFENNLHMDDGSLARDNAQRVAELALLSR